MRAMARAFCSERVLILTLGVVAVASTGCRNKDVVTESYATMGEARAAGAPSRGDLPDGVPESVHDIRTASDLHSGRRWGLFDFPTEDADGIRALLATEEISLAGVECDIPGRIEWWPILLRGRVDAEQAKTAGLQAYRSRQGNLVVVVNWKQGRAYFWKSEV